jgi:flavin-dependent dehydrogenase
MFFDVVVIGSGPAGCAAAISCMQRGLHTLVLTKTKWRREAGMPSARRASESIHPGILGMLERLQAADSLALSVRARYEGIQVGNQVNPLNPGNPADPWEGYHIDRHLFDHALLSSALRQGVSLMDGERLSNLEPADGRVAWIVTASGIRVKCRYLVDASGHRRIAGRLLQFREEACSPVLVAWTGVSVLDGNQPAGPVLPGSARFMPEPDGWSWIAADSGTQCSWTRLARKGRIQFPPPAALAHWQATGQVAVSNRQWSVFRPVCSEGVLLCGDAAGVLDPAAGQGILMALVSGIKAAETIALNLSYPQQEAVNLALYDRWFLQQFYSKADALKRYYRELGIGIF